MLRAVQAAIRNVYIVKPSIILAFNCCNICSNRSDMYKHNTSNGDQTDAGCSWSKVMSFSPMPAMPQTGAATAAASTPCVLIVLLDVLALGMLSLLLAIQVDSPAQPACSNCCVAILVILAMPSTTSTSRW
jgi:hypothetical protein